MPSVGVIVAFVLFILTSGMFCHVFCMATRNITVVEDLFRGPNPYMYDSSLDNLRQLIGPLSSPFAFLPVHVDSSRLSGVSFPQIETAAKTRATEPPEPEPETSSGTEDAPLEATLSHNHYGSV